MIARNLNKGGIVMMSRSSTRSAVCLVTLSVIGAFIVASIRTNAVSEPYGGSEQIAANGSIDGIDIPALAAAVDTASLPSLSVRDPI